MKQKHDPNNIVKNECADSDDYLVEKNDGVFSIGQSYEDKPAQTLYCKHCGGSEFKVGQGHYFTAVKCIKCEYEVCVHEG